jgi:excisionase family DNA binding protein
MTRYRSSEAPAPEHDEILTTDEVAALLKIPKATLYKWVSQGTAPPFYKIGRVNRWSAPRSWPGSTPTSTTCPKDCDRSVTSRARGWTRGFGGRLRGAALLGCRDPGGARQPDDKDSITRTADR